MATKRERDYLEGLFTAHPFRMSDLAYVVSKRGEIPALFNTKQVYTHHVSEVRDLISRCEHEHFGEGFGLFLHYDLMLPLDKIHRVNMGGQGRIGPP